MSLEQPLRHSFNLGGLRDQDLASVPGLGVACFCSSLWVWGRAPGEGGGSKLGCQGLITTIPGLMGTSMCHLSLGSCVSKRGVLLGEQGMLREGKVTLGGPRAPQNCAQDREASPSSEPQVTGSWAGEKGVEQASLPAGSATALGPVRPGLPQALRRDRPQPEPCLWPHLPRSPSQQQ